MRSCLEGLRHLLHRRREAPQPAEEAHGSAEAETELAPIPPGYIGDNSLPTVIGSTSDAVRILCASEARFPAAASVHTGWRADIAQNIRFITSSWVAQEIQKSPKYNFKINKDTGWVAKIDKPGHFRRAGDSYYGDRFLKEMKFCDKYRDFVYGHLAEYVSKDLTYRTRIVVIDHKNYIASKLVEFDTTAFDKSSAIKHLNKMLFQSILLGNIDFGVVKKCGFLSSEIRQSPWGHYYKNFFFNLCGHFDNISCTDSNREELVSKDIMEYLIQLLRSADVAPSIQEHEALLRSCLLSEEFSSTAQSCQHINLREIRVIVSDASRKFFECFRDEAQIGDLRMLHAFMHPIQMQYLYQEGGIEEVNQEILCDEISKSVALQYIYLAIWSQFIEAYHSDEKLSPASYPESKLEYLKNLTPVGELKLTEEHLAHFIKKVYDTFEDLRSSMLTTNNPMKTMPYRAAGSISIA